MYVIRVCTCTLLILKLRLNSFVKQASTTIVEITHSTAISISPQVSNIRIICENDEIKIQISLLKKW